MVVVESFKINNKKLQDSIGNFAVVNHNDDKLYANIIRNVWVEFK